MVYAYSKQGQHKMMVLRWRQEEQGVPNLNPVPLVTWAGYMMIIDMHPIEWVWSDDWLSNVVMDQKPEGWVWQLSMVIGLRGWRFTPIWIPFHPLMPIQISSHPLNPDLHSHSLISLFTPIYHWMTPIPIQVTRWHSTLLTVASSLPKPSRPCSILILACVEVYAISQSSKW